MTLKTQGSVSRLSLSDLTSRTGCGLDADGEAPSGRGFIALLEAFRGTGGTVPGEIVGRLLEERQVGNAVSLAQLVYTGQIFGFEWRGKLWIPMFQFDANNLALKVCAQKVRSELPARWSAWLLASWFAAPNARLDGSSPADMLDSDLDAVLRIAETVQVPAGFELAHVRRPHQLAARA